MFSQQQGIHRLHTFSRGCPKIWVTFESEIWPGTGKCTCGPVYAGNTWTRSWKHNYWSIDTQPKNWEAVAWLSPCATQLYYRLFYYLEDSGRLDPLNDIHLFALHYVYLARINRTLKGFLEGWNLTGRSTCQWVKWLQFHQSLTFEGICCSSERKLCGYPGDHQRHQVIIYYYYYLTFFLILFISVYSVLLHSFDYANSFCSCWYSLILFCWM